MGGSKGRNARSEVKGQIAEVKISRSGQFPYFIGGSRLSNLTSNSDVYFSVLSKHFRNLALLNFTRSVVGDLAVAIQNGTCGMYPL